MAKRLIPSHAEMLSTPWKKKCNVMAVSYGVLGQEQVVVNDRIVNRTVEKVCDPVANNRAFKASDFYLENVIAAGALDSLVHQTYSDVSLDNVDLLDGSVGELIDAIDTPAEPQND